MARQNTFTLVPNPLGMQGLMSRPASGPESKPPMTSKQAQKLYRQANRQPRISKAEQRRLEREEQERIRKELEKEKQAAKARALRERKKAKEQQALEEKKRKGLPLVDVRPSQDTISRFVRGNGLGKKRDSTGAKVDLKLPVVAENPESDKENTEFTAEQEVRPSQGIIPKFVIGNGLGKKRDSTGASLSPVAEDPESDKENKSFPAEEVREGQHKRRRSSLPGSQEGTISNQSDAGTIRKVLQETTNTPNTGERVATHASRISPPRRVQSIRTQARGSYISPNVPAFKQPISGVKSGGVQGPKFLAPSVRSSNARTQPPPPPPLPPPPPPRSTITDRTNPPQEDLISTPPTSTQLFLMSHIDDLFPSPSQQALELQAEQPVPKPVVRPVSRPTETARRVAHMNAMPPPPRPAKKITETPSMPFISTQDLVLSSQDIQDLEAPTTPQPTTRPRASLQTTRSLQEHTLINNHTTALEQGGPEAGISTAKPSSKPPSPPAPQRDSPVLSPVSGVASNKEKPQPPPASREKPRFFSSSGCGLDILFAMDASRKSHAEEERRRQGERQGQNSARRNMSPELTQGQHQDQHGAQPSQRVSQGDPAVGSLPKVTAVTMSQETDYGDLELDAVDFVDLGLEI
jgi:hypothetical protein